MHRRTAYLNSPVKKIQLNLIKNHHKHNLQAMRPMNKSSIDFQFVPINKAKGQYIQDEKFFQIQKQNDLLLKKINQIMNSRDKNKYHHQNKKASKSLNEGVKKQFQNKLDEQNDKMKRRLQFLKSTYQTSKIMKHWVQNKNFAKNSSKFNFNIIESPSIHSRNRSFHLKQDYKSTISIAKMIDGLKFKLKIFENQDKLRIVGDLQNGSDIRIIDIPKADADILIKKHCSGKRQNLLKLLHYDSQTEELLLSAQDTKGEINQNQNLLNPQKALNKNKKKTSVQKRKHILPEDLIYKNGKVSLPQIKKQKRNVEIRNPKIKQTEEQMIQQQNKKSEVKHKDNQTKNNITTKDNKKQLSQRKIQTVLINDAKKQAVLINEQKKQTQNIDEKQKQNKDYEEEFQEDKIIQSNEHKNQQNIQQQGNAKLNQLETNIHTNEINKVQANVQIEQSKQKSESNKNEQLKQQIIKKEQLKPEDKVQELQEIEPNEIQQIKNQIKEEKEQQIQSIQN